MGQSVQSAPSILPSDLPSPSVHQAPAAGCLSAHEADLLFARVEELSQALEQVSDEAAAAKSRQVAAESKVAQLEHQLSVSDDRVRALINESEQLVEVISASS